MTLLPVRVFQDDPVRLSKPSNQPRITEAAPQAFPFTPDIIYSQWPEACGGIDDPLGKFTAGFKVCIIGAGAAGVAGAFEFAKCGADVTLLEKTDHVGGRLSSFKFPGGNNIGEMGTCTTFSFAQNLC